MFIQCHVLQPLRPSDDSACLLFDLFPGFWLCPMIFSSRCSSCSVVKNLQMFKPTTHRCFFWTFGWKSELNLVYSWPWTQNWNWLFFKVAIKILFADEYMSELNSIELCYFPWAHMHQWLSHYSHCFMANLTSVSFYYLYSFIFYCSLSSWSRKASVLCLLPLVSWKHGVLLAAAAVSCHKLHSGQRLTHWDKWEISLWIKRITAQGVLRGWFAICVCVRERDENVSSPVSSVWLSDCLSLYLLLFNICCSWITACSAYLLDGFLAQRVRECEREHPEDYKWTVCIMCLGPVWTKRDLSV